MEGGARKGPVTLGEEADIDKRRQWTAIYRRVSAQA
jgi:hypothetical protein